MEIRPWVRNLVVAAGVAVAGGEFARQSNERDLEHRLKVSKDLKEQKISNHLEDYDIFSFELADSLVELKRILQQKSSQAIEINLYLDNVPKDFPESVEVELVLSIFEEEEMSEKYKKVFEKREILRIGSLDSIEKNNILEQAKLLIAGVIKDEIKR